MSVVDANDFLAKAPEPMIASRPLGKLTPKAFAQSVLNVYDKIGGEEWLVTQALSDPRSFFTLLQRILPKTLDLDEAKDLVFQLVDTFTNITPPGQTATGGNLIEDQSTVIEFEFEHENNNPA